MKKIKNNKYDLEERTASAGEKIIEFAQDVPKNVITSPLISQLIRAGTSVGANYCEANNAQTKKEFVHKISTCKKETRETQHWLRMIVKATPESKEQAKLLWQEAQELVLIFSKILSSSRENQ